MFLPLLSFQIAGFEESAKIEALTKALHVACNNMPWNIALTGRNVISQVAKAAQLDIHYRYVCNVDV